MKKRSRGASDVRGARVRGVAEAVLGTDKRGQSSVYDTRSGTLLTIILLFVLGWIPMIGQMVSGFVGGRKAGSPTRGFIATAVGTFSVLLVMFLTVEILRGINSALISDPEGEIAAMASASPLFQQLLDASLSYARDLFGSADFSINYGVYAMTVPFGIIGGIFADQAQKETRLIVNRTGRLNARKVRSIDAYKEGRSLGFESFEQCTAMSVNSMSSVARPKKQETPAHTVVTKRPVVRTRETPVTATVDKTRVQSTPTSTSSTVRKKSDSEGESTVYI